MGLGGRSFELGNEVRGYFIFSSCLPYPPFFESYLLMSAFTAIIRKSHSHSRHGSTFSAQTSPPNPSVDLPRVNQIISLNSSAGPSRRPNSASSSVFLPSETSFVTSAHHHTHTNTTGEEPSMHQLFSADRLVVSPQATPAHDLNPDHDPMSTADLTKSTVTRFNLHEWPTSRRSSRKKKTSGTETAVHTTTTGSSSSLPMNPTPAMPRPALVSNGNSHIPVLNLPTPSLHVSSRHPFGGPESESGDREASRPSTPAVVSRTGSTRVQAQRPATATNPNTRGTPSPPPSIDSDDLTLEKSPLPPSDDKKQ